MRILIDKLSDQPWIRQVLVALGPLIITVITGMSEAYSATLLPQLTKPNSSIYIDDEMYSWVASIAALPMAGGSILGAYLMEKIGRRSIHIWACIPFCMGWFLIAFAQNVQILLIGRFLTGLSDGVLGPPPNVYIAETSQPNVRGVLMISSSATVVFGVFLVHVLGTFLSWRLTAFFCGVIVIPVAFCMFLVPESPTYLAKQKRYEEAKQAFIWCRGNSREAMKEMDELILRQSDINNTPKISIMETIRNFSNPEFWKPTLLISVLFFTAQMSGNSAVTSYTIQILQECGLSGDNIDEYFTMIMIDSFRVASAIASLILVKKVNRRTLVLIGGYGVSISLFLLSCYHYIFPKTESYSTIFPIVCLACYVCLIAIGLQSLSWTMMGEIFPLATKGTGTAFTSLVCYSFFFIVVQTFPTLLVAFGNIFNVFIFYGVCTCLGTIFSHVFLPETKDKPLHVIEDYFKSKKCDISSAVA